MNATKKIPGEGFKRACLRVLAVGHHRAGGVFQQDFAMPRRFLA
jgi:hypothetical protein